MSLYAFFLSIQYLNICVLFVECWLVMRGWSRRFHTYLFFSCIATLINTIGYTFELKAVTEESYITALQFSYVGRVWIAFALFLFATRLCRINIPGIVTNTLIAIQAAIYIFVLTLKEHTLYYRSYSFSTDGGFPVFIHENGIVHHALMILNMVYIVFGLTWLIVTCRKEKRDKARKRLLVVIVALTTEAVFFVIQTTGLYELTNVYDFTMIGSMLGNVIMFIAIFRYDLLGTTDIAREMMIDRISEGIIAVDNEGIVQYCNDTFREIFPGLDIHSGQIPEEVIRAAGSRTTITIGDRVYSVEVNDLVHKGENLGKLYALIDDTEHYRYMEVIERQRELADSASEAKSRFLANMSHEIRTPINAVLGMDEMILRESTENPIRNYAANIMSAGKTLLSLINDILDLSKVEEGKMEIIPVQYYPVTLINDLVNMTGERALRAGLKFNVSVDEHIPQILYGDEMRIRQCALNILSNAVKYTDEGSVSLDISCEKKDEDHILITFRVRDTGIGMQKEDMEKLFSPYQRLEEKRNRTVEGTGLGMTITRQLLYLMGTVLDVESEYGKGSEFSFTVEQEVVSRDEIGDFSAKINNPEERMKKYHELFHAPAARILVVDDTEMNLSVMENLLKRTQIKIDTALSGHDALDLASVNGYDVLFIDHMMPDMDGIETLTRISQLEKNCGTPAVALTANAVSGARQMYIDAGFTDYLSKPIDGTRLERMLVKLLPEGKVEMCGEDLETEVSDTVREKSRILVVDDDESLCALVATIMEPVYEVEKCLLGKQAVSKAKQYRPDLIILDIHLADSNGFTVMQELKDEEDVAQIPVLLLTGDNDTVTEENGFKSGAADYIRKPFVPDVLKQRVKRIIDLRHYQQSIEKEVDHQTRRNNRLSREMMLSLSKTVDTKDHYTDGHSRRVGELCAEIGRRLGKSGKEQVELYTIGLLHDIGKIGVHEDIIHKSTRLSDDEFTEIKDHTVKGYEILKEISDMPSLCEGARWHHERFDGTGYPDGLAGYDIPENARIACVADCYDAMTSTRTYSVPKSQADVRAEFVRCSGKNFDPAIAEVMIAMIDEDSDYSMNENARSGDVWKEYGRLWEGTEQTVGDETDDAGVLPEYIRSIPELDLNAGIKNCGSAEGYISVITVFHQTAPAKADEIEKLHSEGNIPDYTIRVHALKSSARIIGAAELSKLAEELEDAGKRGDTGFIDANTERLLEGYRSLDAKLVPPDREERGAGLPAMDKAALTEAYQTVTEIAGSMDYGLMEDLIKDLGTYELPAADKEDIEKIETLLTGLDWDGIKETAGSALKRIMEGL